MATMLEPHWMGTDNSEVKKAFEPRGRSKI